MFVSTFFYNTINGMCVYLIRQYRHRQKSSLSESGLLRRHIAPLLHNRLLHFSRIGLGPFYTECSLNIVFFQKILEYSELWSFSVYPRCQCVYTHKAGWKPGLAAELAELRKIQNFKVKNTIFNEHPVGRFIDIGD